MTEQQDGGPAFPGEQGECQDGTWNQTWDPGMSLEEYYVGCALTGLSVRSEGSLVCPEDIALRAWQIAVATVARAERHD